MFGEASARTQHLLQHARAQAEADQDRLRHSLVHLRADPEGEPGRGPQISPTRTSKGWVGRCVRPGYSNLLAHMRLGQVGPGWAVALAGTYKSHV